MEIKCIESEQIFFAKMNRYSFKLSDKKWQLDKENCVYPHKVVDRMPTKMKLSYLKTLAYYASEYSSFYIQNINTLFYKWFGAITIDTIDDKAIYQLNVYLGSERNYKLNLIKAFIIKWKNLNYPGVEATAIRMLEKIKIIPNQTGDAVKRRDPNKGPLTETEFNKIINAVGKFYHEKKIQCFLYCYILLLAITGRRPLQLISLKAKDLIKNERGCFLNVPKVKQRKCFRKEFNMVMIEPFLYDSLSMLINQNQAFVEDKFSVGISNYRGELPIFMNLDKITETKRIEDFLYDLTTDFFHMKNSVMSKLLKHFPSKFDVRSERTNSYIELNARRFRYTLGSRLANEGASIEVIAKALDHKSVNSSMIYIKNNPDNVYDIDKRLSAFFNPLSNILMGIEIEENKKFFIKYVSDAFFLLEDTKEDLKCLTCKKFNPWRAL
ncbi:tyrosine-type recombinase/integrase [Escherichia coli]|uniref:tyrosine-type recombinase/integrase n=1 Tax=Escherichia coli TaxID=562 RepID=UPI001FF407F1|nr:tyrosine-type recombinase/integrase [Escherichia coli]MCJ8439184.1 site-specific integrase [Escherichia coli]MCJ8443766.1 site-specific integrase [Escherichia coli]MCJ8448450.1 site-specific integrase [Escherichia coli]MCJ8484936.1 site-specific integrase [Escherichia coli]